MNCHEKKPNLYCLDYNCICMLLNHLTQPEAAESSKCAASHRSLRSHLACIFFCAVTCGRFEPALVERNFRPCAASVALSSGRPLSAAFLFWCREPPRLSSCADHVAASSLSTLNSPDAVPTQYGTSKSELYKRRAQRAPSSFSWESLSSL